MNDYVYIAHSHFLSITSIHHQINLAVLAVTCFMSPDQKMRGKLVISGFRYNQGREQHRKLFKDLTE